MKQKILLFIITLIVVLVSCNKNNQATSSISGIGDITINPYGLTPLSAAYRTSSINASPITVTVKGQHGEEDLIHTYPAGYGNEFEIHGLYPECNNTITVNDGGRIITKNVYVGQMSVNGINIPSKFTVEVNKLEEDKYPNNPDIYFARVEYGNVVLGITKNGYVRYYINNIGAEFNVILEKNKICHYTDSGIYSLIGNRMLTTQGFGLHHDIINVNGNYLALSLSKWGIEDGLTIINNNSQIVKKLSFGKLIKDIVYKNNNPDEIKILNQIVFDEENIHKNSQGQEIGIDWFHGNSIVYDSSTDILYASSRNRGVLAIDYSEWKLIWWMADDTLSTVVNPDASGASGAIPYNVHLKDLPSLEAYRVKGDALNDGPKNQHALFLLANGNLAMFDNQGDEDNNVNGSRYVEYKITGTHGNYTAQKNYDYRDPQLYSRYTSDVDYTGERYENVLITYGRPMTILEINKENSTEIFKLKININYSGWIALYRADKLPLYYDEGRVYSEDYNLKN